MTVRALPEITDELADRLAVSQAPKISALEPPSSLPITRTNLEDFRGNSRETFLRNALTWPDLVDLPAALFTWFS